MRADFPNYFSVEQSEVETPVLKPGGRKVKLTAIALSELQGNKETAWENEASSCYSRDKGSHIERQSTLIH